MAATELLTAHRRRPAPAQDLRWAPLRPHERAGFDREGHVVVREALAPDLLGRVTRAVDRIHAEETRSGRIAPGAALHLQGAFDRDPVLLDLLDHPATFRFVWGLLGWNVYTHHHHLDVHPPEPGDAPLPWNWHQDGYRQNGDVDADPRPMLSLKVGFALTDLTVPGSGATRLLPGSHVANTLAGRPARPGDAYVDPVGARSIALRPGDAFVFDRRLWHSRARNTSPVTRKLVFVGYTHRWIRPLDETDYRRDRDWFAALPPLRRQLLGDGGDHASYWGVDRGGWVDRDIPLRRELDTRGLLDGSRPFLR